jgi:hypothetical protein
MEKIDKLKTIQSIILGVVNTEYIEFEFDKFETDSLKIIFKDNYSVKKVCAILEPLCPMYINFYIDYDAKLGKIVCEIF